MSALPRPAYDFAPSACGGLRTTVAGVEVLMRASGALWAPGSRVLIVADLHLEKGSAYAARGQMLPPYDTRETLSRLAAEVAALSPDAVVLLGDTFHDGRSEDRLAADDAERLRALGRGRTLIWVVGNHDADGPRALPGEVSDEMVLAGLILRHEPQPGPQFGEVAGHLHPAARVTSTRGTVRRRCFISDGERLILPAFGAYAGGLNVRDAAFGGMFVRPPLAGALGAHRIHAVGWRSLTGD
jgi:DNA ligase-associated metallophosphoesterase